MSSINKLILIIFLFLSLFKSALAESHNLYEIIQILQKDLKTLEKAVYSESLEISNDNEINLNSNEEEVLTRHLLKLSEIEKQFQDLTNRFEEINFKLDKLSTRLTKMQSDNQYRFQKLENYTGALDGKTSLTSSEKDDKILPGSSQPQDLGSVSYKDMGSDNEIQETQSIDTTQAILT